MRILFAPEGDAGGGALNLDGGGVAGGTPKPAEGGVTGKGFDWEQTLPDDLPAEITSLKGKKFKDFIDSYKSLRQTLTERGNKVTELEKAKAQLEEGLKQANAKSAGLDDPEVARQRGEAAKKQMARYQEVVENYVETGEVDEEFIKSVEGTGVRVTQDTMLDFLEFQRFSRGAMVKELAAYMAEETVTPEVVTDILGWLRSGQSPFDQEERKGFDKMHKRGNNAWFDTVLEEYRKEFGDEAPAGKPKPKAGGFRGRKPGPTRSGRPIKVADGEGFKSSGEFQNALIAVRRDGALTPGQRREKERDLIARRRRQLGEA